MSTRGWEHVSERDLKPKARSKYRAVKTTIDGLVFDSKKEAARYQELKMLQRAGKIRDLELQPEYTIWVDTPSGTRALIADYRGDFRYRTVPWDYEEAETVVEDVKGFKTPIYRLKKKLVEAQYGITIREI